MCFSNKRPQFSLTKKGLDLMVGKVSYKSKKNGIKGGLWTVSQGVVEPRVSIIT